jgi:hypothetical protein
MTTRKVTAKDAAQASAVLDANAKAKAKAAAKADSKPLPSEQADKAQAKATRDNARAQAEATKPAANGAANGKAEPLGAATIRAADEAKAAKAPKTAKDKLLRTSTKTVQSYVAWLKGQLGDDWAALSADPVRLAEVSLQNYGAWQAAKRSS